MSQRWNWLKERLNKLGSNPARFAKELNWPSSRVYELFSGKTKAIPIDRIAKAAELLNIRLDSMLNFNSGISDEIAINESSIGLNYAKLQEFIPEIDFYKNYNSGEYINRPENYNQDSCQTSENQGFLCESSVEYQAGTINNQRIKNSWGIPYDYLKELNVQPKDIYIIEVIGDNMKPTICNSDKVIIDSSIRGKLPSPAGIFAIWDGLGVSINRIEPVPNSNPQKLKISSDNSNNNAYECLLSECHIIGRIVSVVKRL